MPASVFAKIYPNHSMTGRLRWDPEVPILDETINAVAKEKSKLQAGMIDEDEPWSRESGIPFNATLFSCKVGSFRRSRDGDTPGWGPMCPSIDTWPSIENPWKSWMMREGTVFDLVRRIDEWRGGLAEVQETAMHALPLALKARRAPPSTPSDHGSGSGEDAHSQSTTVPLQRQDSEKAENVSSSKGLLDDTDGQEKHVPLSEPNATAEGEQAPVSSSSSTGEEGEEAPVSSSSSNGEGGVALIDLGEAGSLPQGDMLGDMLADIEESIQAAERAALNNNVGEARQAGRLAKQKMDEVMRNKRKYAQRSKASASGGGRGGSNQRIIMTHSGTSCARWHKVPVSLILSVADVALVLALLILFCFIAWCYLFSGFVVSMIPRNRIPRFIASTQVKDQP